MHIYGLMSSKFLFKFFQLITVYMFKVSLSSRGDCSIVSVWRVLLWKFSLRYRTWVLRESSEFERNRNISPVHQPHFLNFGISLQLMFLFWSCRFPHIFQFCSLSELLAMEAFLEGNKVEGILTIQGHPCGLVHGQDGRRCLHIWLFQQEIFPP